MIKSRLLAGLIPMIVLTGLATGTGCAPAPDFDRQLGAITRPYRFDLGRWELRALGHSVGRLFGGGPEAPEDSSAASGFFNTAGRINRLEEALGAVRPGDSQGDAAALGEELEKLRAQHEEEAAMVTELLETQIREALADEGIYHPLQRYIRVKAAFPPVDFRLEEPPHLLVVSPRDRIESLREVTLKPGITVEEMEGIEAAADKLDVSSLVVELGGLGTYPSYVTDRGDLRFTLDTVAHEWLHQYLAFKPLGFRYLLDLTGIRRDYEIATMNETVAGMVGREIGDSVYQAHYAGGGDAAPVAAAEAGGFDFNAEMRAIRRAVDAYLAAGEIERAEGYMEERRQYLAAHGYHIRKLNQAYFAFYGTYADLPTSVSPIGADLRELRRRSASLKDFLETAAALTSRRELELSLEEAK